jgi:hypothetical protein
MLAIEIPRVQQRANDWLRASEDAARLATRMTARERTIIQLLRWTGLRIQEPLWLQVADFALSCDEIYVRRSKTSRGIRTVPIFPPLRPHLNDWLSYAHPVPPVPDRPFLITRNGDPMHHQYVRHTVKRVADRRASAPTKTSRPIPCAARSAPTSSTVACGSKWSHGCWVTPAPAPQKPPTPSFSTKQSATKRLPSSADLTAGNGEGSADALPSSRSTSTRR